MLHEGTRNRCQHHWGDTRHISHGRTRARERAFSKAYLAGAPQDVLDDLEDALQQADRRVDVYDRCGPYGLFAGTATWVRAYAEKHADLDQPQLIAKLCAELGHSDRAWLAKQSLPHFLEPWDYNYTRPAQPVVLPYQLVRQHLDSSGYLQALFSIIKVSDHRTRCAVISIARGGDERWFRQFVRPRCKLLPTPADGLLQCHCGDFDWSPADFRFSTPQFDTAHELPSVVRKAKDELYTKVLREHFASDYQTLCEQLAVAN